MKLFNVLILVVTLLVSTVSFGSPDGVKNTKFCEHYVVDALFVQDMKAIDDMNVFDNLLEHKTIFDVGILYVCACTHCTVIGTVVYHDYDIFLRGYNDEFLRPTEHSYFVSHTAEVIQLGRILQTYDLSFMDYNRERSDYHYYML